MIALEIVLLLRVLLYFNSNGGDEEWKSFSNKKLFRPGIFFSGQDFLFLPQPHTSCLSAIFP